MSNKKMMTLLIALVAVAAVSTVFFISSDDSTAVDDKTVIDTEVVVKAGEKYELKGVVEFKNGGKLVADSGSTVIIGSPLTIMANSKDTITLKEGSFVSVLNVSNKMTEKLTLGVEGQIKYDISIDVSKGMSVKINFAVSKGSITLSDVSIKFREDSNVSFTAVASSVPMASDISGVFAKIFAKGFVGTVTFNGFADISIADTLSVSFKGDFKADMDMASKSDKYILSATHNIVVGLNFSDKNLGSIDGSVKLSGSSSIDITKAIPLMEKVEDPSELLPILLNNMVIVSDNSITATVNKANLSINDTKVVMDKVSVVIGFVMNASDIKATLSVSADSIAVSNADMNLDVKIKNLKLSIVEIPESVNIPFLMSGIAGIKTIFESPEEIILFLQKYYESINVAFKINASFDSFSMKIGNFSADVGSLNLSVDVDSKEATMSGKFDLKVSNADIKIFRDSYELKNLSAAGEFEDLVLENLMRFAYKGMDSISKVPAIENILSAFTISADSFVNKSLSDRTLEIKDFNFKKENDVTTIKIPYLSITEFTDIDSDVDRTQLVAENLNFNLAERLIKSVKISNKVYFADGSVSEVRTDGIDINAEKSEFVLTNGKITSTANGTAYGWLPYSYVLGKDASLDIKKGTYLECKNVILDGGKISGTVQFYRLITSDINLSSSNFNTMSRATFDGDKVSVKIIPKEGFILKESETGVKYTLNADGTATVTEFFGTISPATEAKKYKIFVDDNLIGEVGKGIRARLPSVDGVVGYVSDSGSTYRSSILMPAHDVKLKSVYGDDLGILTKDVKLDKDGFRCQSSEDSKSYRITLKSGVIFEISSKSSISVAQASELKNYDGPGKAYGIYANGGAKLFIPVDGFNNPTVYHVGEHGKKVDMNPVQVTIDGKKYLQIETTDYSQYAVMELGSGSGSGVSTYVIAIVVVILAMAVLVFLLKKKGKI